jgi:hypothetical protein
VGYVIYRSTDSLNFSFVDQLPAGSTSSMQTGLTASTPYHWRIYAVTEGALSSHLSGTQATAAPGRITTTGSGNWSSTIPDAPWPGGMAPSSSDSVVIGDGHTVTIDADPTVFKLDVGQGTSGVLEFEETTARTLTVLTDVSISSGASLRTAATGSQAGHSLSLSGSLMNEGVLDFSTNGNSAQAGIVFNASGDVSFSGAGTVTDISSIEIDIGDGNALTLSTDSLTVQGAGMSAPPFLTLTSGVFRLSGAFTMSGTLFGSPAYVIGSDEGLWLDNPNFELLAQSGSPAVSGLLRVSSGTAGVGTALDDNLRLGTGATLILEGGAVNVAGRFAVTSSGAPVTYTQTGGTLTAGMVGHASADFATFDLGTSGSSSATISGGSIIIENANSDTLIPRDYRNRAGTQSVTGGLLQLGTASSDSAHVFYVRGTAPGVTIGNAPAGHTVILRGDFTATGVLQIDPGATLDLSGKQVIVRDSLANSGTITGATSGSERRFQ